MAEVAANLSILRRKINAYSADAQPIQWKYPDPSRRIRSNDLSAAGH